MTVDQVLTALNLPRQVRVDRRIPKSTLSERGAATAADRKLIDRTVDRLDWLGSLSPATVGIAPSPDPIRPVGEVQLLSMSTKLEPTRRVFELVHRAIPYPVVLLVSTPAGKIRMSLAPLRPAERIADQLVVERLVITPEIETGDKAFLASLQFEGLSRLDLRLLYDGLIERAEGLTASRLSGQAFRLPATPAEAELRRLALSDHQAKETEWIATKAAARKEKRLAEQVRISEQARLLGVELAAIAARMA
jgi:hypothetical protein